MIGSVVTELCAEGVVLYIEFWILDKWNRCDYFYD